MANPVIDFKGYEIENLELKKVNDDIDKASVKNDISCGIKQNLKNAIVKIETTINDPENKRKVLVTLNGFFDLDESIVNQQQALNYLSVNGVAILFPYVRSVVSMVTTLDSNSPIILPTVNTSEFNESLEN